MRVIENIPGALAFPMNTSSQRWTFKLTVNFPLRNKSIFECFWAWHYFLMQRHREQRPRNLIELFSPTITNKELLRNSSTRTPWLAGWILADGPGLVCRRWEWRTVLTFLTFPRIISSTFNATFYRSWVRVVPYHLTKIWFRQPPNFVVICPKFSARWRRRRLLGAK
jgi:hypothetical protein